MSLTDITNKILSDANKKAENIIGDGQKELDKILAEKNQQIVNAIQIIKDRSKERALKIQEQTEFKERMLKKNILLTVKQELIDQVFETAKEKLLKLNDEEFINLMVKMLQSTDMVEDAEIITSSSKKDLIKKAIQKAGLSYKISDKNLPKGEDGFILSSKIVEVNNTIENYINTSKKEFSVVIAKRLFE